MRLPSVIASLLTIAVVYFGTERNFGRRAGAIIAVLLALSAQQLFFSHQVRSYMLLFLAVSLSCFALLEVMREGRHRRLAWTLYALGAAAGINLHTTACLWPAAASLALIASDRRYVPFVGERWRELVAANLLIVLGAAWWIRIVILQMNSLEGSIGWIAPPVASAMPRFFLDAVFLAHEARGPEITAPILLACLAGIGAIRGWHDPRVRFCVAAFGISALLFFLVSLKQPIILDRTVLWLSLFPLILIARCVQDATLRSPMTFVLLAAAVLLGINQMQTIPALQREDWRLPVRSAASTPKAIVLVDGEAMSVAMTMACKTELGRASCPFTIFALMVPGKTMDLWAHGYGGGKANPDLSGARTFTYSRWAHDPLDELHKEHLLTGIVNEPDSFVGPLPPNIWPSILTCYRLEVGLLQRRPACFTGPGSASTAH